MQAIAAGIRCYLLKTGEQRERKSGGRLTQLARRHETGSCMKSIKQIGASGQISLGKEFAGRTVVIDSNEPGIWVIKTAQTIPDGELWLHQAAAAERLDRALTCLDHPPEAADLDAWNTTSMQFLLRQSDPA